MNFQKSFVRGGVIALALTAFGAAAHAAGSVGWLNPANGASFPVGTTVMPDGNANAGGAVTGSGLDLVLVLDSSGSMRQNVPLASGGITRQDLQKQAANALVNGLPAGSNVAVVEFDSRAAVEQSLTPIPSAGVTAAINAVGRTGSTRIDLGIDEAVKELLANGTVGNSQQILVISDGGNDPGTPTPASRAAIAAGLGFTVNTVGFPGINSGGANALRDTATAGLGTFVDFSGDPSNLLNIFSGGAGGVLVGVEKVEITDPNGVTREVAVGTFGAFKTDAFGLKLGANTWTALATFTNGNTASQSLTLFGTSGGGANVIPLPASGILLLAGLAGLGMARRRRS